MSSYYFDTSALIKRYVTELGTPWVTNLLSVTPALLFTSRLTIVETRSALARRRREASISPRDHTDALAAFVEDGLTLYRFVDFDATIADLAGDLLDRHPLRAYDAIQLASALRINQALASAGLSGPIFVSADNNQLSAATAEGLSIDNPNNHP